MEDTAPTTTAAAGTPAAGTPAAGQLAAAVRGRSEQATHHRAFLLWAMQAPDLRSARAVARAVGRSDATIRKWMQAQRWPDRAQRLEPDGDQLALDQYRADYLADFGQLELPQVARHVVRTIGPLDWSASPAAKAAHEARVRVAAATPRAAMEAEQAAAQAIATHKRDSRQDAERHIKLVDASLGLIARRLKDGEVRVGVRDIPVLLDCRQRLVDVVSGTYEASHGPVVETARVRHAKETGGDVVAAMHEDALELVAILGALQSSKGQDLGQLAAAHDTLQDAQASS